MRTISCGCVADGHRLDADCQPITWDGLHSVLNNTINRTHTPKKNQKTPKGIGYKRTPCSACTQSQMERPSRSSNYALATYRAPVAAPHVPCHMPTALQTFASCCAYISACHPTLPSQTVREFGSSKQRAHFKYVGAYQQYRIQCTHARIHTPRSTNKNTDVVHRKLKTTQCMQEWHEESSLCAQLSWYLPPNPTRTHARDACVHMHVWSLAVCTPAAT